MTVTPQTYSGKGRLSVEETRRSSRPYSHHFTFTNGVHLTVIEANNQRFASL